jgi:hypothetical protein
MICARCGQTQWIRRLRTASSIFFNPPTMTRAASLSPSLPQRAQLVQFSQSSYCSKRLNPSFRPLVGLFSHGQSFNGFSRSSLSPATSGSPKGCWSASHRHLLVGLCGATVARAFFTFTCCVRLNLGWFSVRDPVSQWDKSRSLHRRGFPSACHGLFHIEWSLDSIARFPHAHGEWLSFVGGTSSFDFDRSSFHLSTETSCPPESK